MKTKNINALLVGCGRISQKHFHAIGQLSELGANIVAVSDLNIEKCAQLVGNEKNIFQTTNFLDDQALISCNLGVILSESGNHFEHAAKLLRRNIDVLLEKPATLTLEDADSLENLAAEHGCKVYVVKQNRHNPPVQQARAAFDSGKLGKLNIGTIRVRWCRPQTYYDQAPWRGTWQYDGGVITNQASHHIDLLQWFMGPIKSVRAYASTFGVDIEAEDTVVAAIEFESGALGTLEATTSVRPRNLEGSLSLIGSNGCVEIGGFAVNKLLRLETASDVYSDDMSVNKNETEDTSDVYGNGHVKVYEEIIKDRNGSENKAVTLGEAKKSLEIIHMIYKSIEENRTIYSIEGEIKSNCLGVKVR